MTVRSLGIPKIPDSRIQLADDKIGSLRLDGQQGVPKRPCIGKNRIDRHGDYFEIAGSLRLFDPFAGDTSSPGRYYFLDGVLEGSGGEGRGLSLDYFYVFRFSDFSQGSQVLFEDRPVGDQGHISCEGLQLDGCRLFRFRQFSLDPQITILVDDRAEEEDDEGDGDLDEITSSVHFAPFSSGNFSISIFMTKRSAFKRTSLVVGDANSTFLKYREASSFGKVSAAEAA